MANISLLAITVLCAVIAYLLLRKWQGEVTAHKHGCQSTRSDPHEDRFFGIHLLLNTGSAIQEHRYLTELTRRYTTLGNTFSAKNLGSSSINSIEPENIETVFSTKSNDWGVEPVRLPAQDPFCGRGFITTDGTAWRHSRSLLRPSFNKGDAVDLSSLGTLLEKVIDRIPSDGSTVDLQPLLFSLFRLAK